MDRNMNQITKDILTNIINRKQGKEIKQIHLDPDDIVEAFFLPLFRPGNKIDEYLSYVIFNPCSYIELDSDILYTALQFLSEELEDETNFEYDYDKHHGINKSVDYWHGTIGEKILKKIDDKDEYYNCEEEDPTNYYIKKIGWTNLLTSKDDDLFEREFLKFIDAVMDEKVRQFRSLKIEIDEYHELQSQL